MRREKIRCPAKDGKQKVCGRHIATIVTDRDRTIEVVAGKGGYIEPNIEEWFETIYNGQPTGEIKRRTFTEAFCSKHGFVVSIRL